MKLLEAFDPDVVNQIMQESTGDDVWQNDDYQVIVRRFNNPDFQADMIHLSIRRMDREAIHDWRDLQEIKNLIVGTEHEAMEIYPAESRLVDTANQYHLWVFADPTVRIPIGWFQRLTSWEANLPELPNAKQREKS